MQVYSFTITILQDVIQYKEWLPYNIYKCLWNKPLHK